MCGYTASSDFPTANGYESDYGGGAYDAFVSKFNAAGNGVIYSTYLGGSAGDAGIGLAIDGSGNVYVTGYTESDNFPTTEDAYDTSHNGGPDVFVTKLDPDGDDLIYSTYLGGSTAGSGDDALRIAVDASGCAYVTGRTFSDDFPTTAGVFQTAKNNGTTTSDIFVTKFNDDGSDLVYSTYLGGSATDRARGMALDDDGNVCISGWTDSTDFPTKDPYQGSNSGGRDIVLAKLNSTGSALIYSTYYGGSNNDLAYGLALDASGNTYIAGPTDSTDFPTESAFQSIYGGGDGDCFVARFTPDGDDVDYATYLGGTGHDFCHDIVLKGTEPYVTGPTNSVNFPTENPYHDSLVGNYDVFITKFNSSGETLSYSTYLGGEEADGGVRISLDTTGNVFATGVSSDGFPLVDPYQSTYGGGASDAFVLKYYGENATLVELTSFRAMPFENDIRLEWTTASELNAAGFHLLRSPTADGTYTRITDAMIPARGGSMWETRYTYEDFGPVPGHTCYYKLEDIDDNGHSAFHGPVSAWRGMVDIKVNGSDDPVVILPDAPVSVFVDLSFGFHESQCTELWIVAATPFLPPLDWYSFTTVSGWQPGIHPWAQQPFNLSLPFEVFNGALSTGTYLLYVAVDDPDGVPAGPWLGLDSVEVTVGE